MSSSVGLTLGRISCHRHRHWQPAVKRVNRTEYYGRGIFGQEALITHSKGGTKTERFRVRCEIGVRKPVFLWLQRINAYSAKRLSLKPMNAIWWVNRVKIVQVKLRWTMRCVTITRKSRVFLWVHWLKLLVQFFESYLAYLSAIYIAQIMSCREKYTGNNTSNRNKRRTCTTWLSRPF